jgi:hypothetical protein
MNKKKNPIRRKTKQTELSGNERRKGEDTANENIKSFPELNLKTCHPAQKREFHSVSNLR